MRIGLGMGGHGGAGVCTSSPSLILMALRVASRLARLAIVLPFLFSFFYAYPDHTLSIFVLIFWYMEFERDGCFCTLSDSHIPCSIFQQFHTLSVWWRWGWMMAALFASASCA